MTNNANAPVNAGQIPDRGWSNVAKSEPAPKPELIQDALDYVTRFVDDAIAAGTKIGADQRLSFQAKAEDWQAIKGEKTAELEERIKYQTDKLTQERNSLRNKARLSVAPSPEQAAMLQYTRDALQSRWRVMARDEMTSDWQAAIDAGDQVTARVYRDFVLPKLQPQRKRSTDGDYSGLIPADYKKLAALTDDLLSTPDQKKARQELTKVEATLNELTFTASKARAMLRNAKLNQKGELIDTAREAVRQQIRSTF